MEKITPLMQQYLDIKGQNPDKIVFFRLGDFYEMFLEDATVASKILNITLTSRNKEAENPVPMCGVPFHSAKNYIAKLLNQGLKVAVCEQMEDPAQAKGLVKREVTHVLSPGLTFEEETLEAKTSNYLLSVYREYPFQGELGLAYIDITTCDFYATPCRNLAEFQFELSRVNPKEIVLFREDAGLEAAIRGFNQKIFINRLPAEAFNLADLTLPLEKKGPEAEQLSQLPYLQKSLAGMIRYIRETNANAARHIQALQFYRPKEFLILGETTLRNLEILRTLFHGEKRGSLIALIDRTNTAMGGRLIRNWVCYPLMDLKKIQIRQEMVAELKQYSEVREGLKKILQSIYDLDRINGKIGAQLCNPIDLARFRDSLAQIPEICRILKDPRLNLLKTYFQIDPLTDIHARIAEALTAEPPMNLRSKGVFKKEYSAELADLYEICHHSKDWMVKYEARERETTKISSLKIRYNKVFGFYIEISNANLSKVPPNYNRKQTLVNGERYITEELKAYENKVLNAEEMILALENRYFKELVEAIANHHHRIKQTVRLLAELDAIFSLAELAYLYNYNCPKVTVQDRLEIEEGRHPVLEALLEEDGQEKFIPNHIRLDTQDNQIMIITGPNMAGKSTIMRQVALICILAQMGSFVPAKSADIGLVDQIFTRVGAADIISKGQSTFMVEMLETQEILQNATRNSLIILDEIGRGTSTYDGVSIAWSIAEYIHDKIGAKTLFATHYHELTELSQLKPRIKNFNIAVKEFNDQIIFLRTLEEGGTNRSYGIQVAKLAGISDEIINRAKEVLSNLEKGEFDTMGLPKIGRSKKLKRDEGQMYLFGKDLT